MLKETSWASAVRAGPRRKPSGHGLEHLEFAAELFLDADFSLAFLKLRARLSSLLKLLTLLRLGLARCGLSSGELAGSGERQPRGEGDLDTWRLLRSRRSKGDGDLDTAGVERGDSSAMSQYSSRMSGVDCLLSPLSTPAVSRSPSPFDLRDLNSLQVSRSPSPRGCRSPLPANSPLLSPHLASPSLNRVKSFNKELRRARSFRNAREKSASRNSSAANSRCSSPCPEGFLRGPALTAEAQEVSFSIKKSFGSRKGWKIMPDDGQQNIDSSALQNVVSLIKDMELKGFAVPERISIKYLDKKV